MGSSLSDMLRGVLNSDGAIQDEGSSDTQTLTGNGKYKKVDTIAFFKNGMGKPTQVGEQSKSGDASLTSSQPEEQGQPSWSGQVSFANPQPVEHGQPSRSGGVSFANPQPVVQMTEPVENPEENPGNLRIQPIASVDSVPADNHTAAPKMRRCSGCSREISAENGFCPYCATPAPKKCPDCGTEILDDYVYCPGCRRRLNNN